MSFSGKRNWQALGRLKPGEMNKTEKSYAQYLDLLKHAHAIQWYSFEGMKFRLADNTFYTPDFAVMNHLNELEMHEVKGSRFIFQDDAKVKIKVANELYPFRFIVVFKTKTGWELEEIGNSASHEKPV